MKKANKKPREWYCIASELLIYASYLRKKDATKHLNFGWPSYKLLGFKIIKVREVLPKRKGRK